MDKNINVVNFDNIKYINDLYINYKENCNLKARNKLIESFEPIIYHIFGQLDLKQFDKNVLFKHAIRIIDNSIDKYDISKGAKFTTYIYSCIKWGLILYIRNVNSELALSRKYQKIYKIVDSGRFELINELNKEPTDAQLIEYLKQRGIEEKDYRKLIIKLNAFKTPIPYVESSASQSKENNLFDQSLDINGDDLKEIFKKKLTEMEINVLNKVFGLNGFNVMTLEAIGKEYNLSKERIRQIKAKALFKIKRTMQSNQ